MRGVAGKVFSGRFSRAERAKRRSRISLDDAALGDKTCERYYLALRKLLDRAMNYSYWMLKRVTGSGKCGVKVGPFSPLVMPFQLFTIMNLVQNGGFHMLGNYSLFGEKWKFHPGRHLSPGTLSKLSHPSN